MDMQRNGYINKLLLITLFQAIIPFIAFAQEFEPVKENMEIVVTSKDSIQRIHIQTAAKDVSMENDVVYYWYANNRVNYNRGGYTGKLLHGLYSVFNKDGKLVILGQFKQGTKIGIWKFWDKGILLRQEAWKKGKLHGKVFEYDPSGKIVKASPYKHGLLDGKELIYEQDTVIIHKYKNGKMIVAKIKKPKKEKKIEPKKKEAKPADKKKEPSKPKLKSEKKENTKTPKTKDTTLEKGKQK